MCVSRSTKLFQEAGSPLIQGHSKMERSLLGEWAIGFALSLLVGLVGLWAWTQVASGGLEVPAAADVFALVRATLVLFGPGALVGSVMGAGVGRGFGWRRYWRAGAVGGLLGGAIAVLALRAAAATLLGI